MSDLTRKQLEEKLAAMEAENLKLREAPASTGEDPDTKEQLANALAQIEEMKRRQPAPQAPEDASMKARLADALRELDALRAERTVRPPTTDAKGTKVKPRPYRGHVQAVETCWAGHPVKGPRQEGDVFEVDLPALYNDDPFVPVVVIGTTESGRPIVKPHAEAVVADFLDRPQVRVSTDLPPLRASQF